MSSRWRVQRRGEAVKCFVDGRSESPGQANVALRQQARPAHSLRPLAAGGAEGSRRRHRTHPGAASVPPKAEPLLARVEPSSRRTSLPAHVLSGPSERRWSTLPRRSGRHLLQPRTASARGAGAVLTLLASSEPGGDPTCPSLASGVICPRVAPSFPPLPRFP